MLSSNLGLIVSYCALGASAFLLPAGTTPARNKDVAFASLGLDQKHHSIALPCSSCAFPSKSEESIQDNDQFWAQGGAKSLALDFTVSEDNQALLLNGKAIFPEGYAVRDIEDDWTVKQIPATITQEELAFGTYSGTTLRITGQVFGTDGAKSLTPEGDDVVTIRWQLFSLEHQLMTVDEVVVQVLRTSEGELLILSVDIEPGLSMSSGLPMPTFHPLETPKHKECTLPGPLCRLEKIFQSGTGPHNKHAPCPKAGDWDGHLPTHIKPQFGAHHGPHQHHHHRHSVFHRFASGVLSVLLPVVAGITVGMVVSAAGLLFGQFVGWLWFTVIRGQRRGYNRVATDDSIAAAKDTESRVESTEDTEPLPRYEDAPAYEETEKEVV